MSRTSKAIPAFCLASLFVVSLIGISPLGVAATSTGAQQGFSVCGTGYGATPDGCAPLACIHVVGDGATVSALPDGSALVTYPDGQTQTFPPCGTQGGPAFPTNGWVEDAQDIKTTTKMTGDWTTPKAPSSNDYQLIYMFIGTQNCICGSAMIIQPVIQWGYYSANGGGPYWSFASWYVYSGGYYVSSLFNITTGDKLQGLLTKTGSGDWTITGADKTSGNSTTLKTTGIPTQDYDFVTLEVYDVTACNQYPAGHSTTFSQVQVNKHTVSGWTLNVLLNDGCGEKVTSPNHSTFVLHY